MADAAFLIEHFFTLGCGAFGRRRFFWRWLCRRVLCQYRYRHAQQRGPKNQIVSLHVSPFVVNCKDLSVPTLSVAKYGASSLVMQPAKCAPIFSFYGRNFHPRDPAQSTGCSCAPMGLSYF